MGQPTAFPLAGAHDEVCDRPDEEQRA